MESDGLVWMCPCSCLFVIIVNFYNADILFCNTSTSHSSVRTVPSLSFAKNAEGCFFFFICVLSFWKYELLAHSSVSSDWSGCGRRGLVSEQLTWLEKLAGNLAGLPTGANRWFDPSPHLAVFSFHFLFSPSLLCGWIVMEYSASGSCHSSQGSAPTHPLGRIYKHQHSINHTPSAVMRLLAFSGTRLNSYLHLSLTQSNTRLFALIFLY